MDIEEIRKWHKAFKQDNELFEIRVLGDRTWSGYFYDVEMVIKKLEPFDNANIYYSVNEVKKACASREQFDCFKQVKGTATSEQDIKHRWWLPIDIDCERPSGVSSTDEEKTISEERRTVKMSVAINIEHAVKKYGDTTVIPDLSVSVKNGEFFTLLGPSGCGKTTLLRMIAGFNTVEGGYFKFNDRIINDMEPGKRDIGMVFQNYAIFPNMTVRKNVEFGLKYKNVPKEQRSKEADKFLKLVHVDQYADRMPERLSGGQQQRVALWMQS